MINLSVNQIVGNNSNNVNGSIFDNTPESIKLNCNPVYKNHNQSYKKFSYDHCNTNKFAILHQNIHGISNKTDEFLNSLPPNAPQAICLTEHHLRAEEISNVNLSQFYLGASFCRRTYSRGSVCIFVTKNMQFYIINLDQYNKEKEFEICALKLHILSNSFILICTYRSPTGNFPYFLNQLELILNKIYKISTEIILCGDFNINYFNDNSRKHLLDSLLASFSLFSTVKFPTNNFNNSCTLIDNIYINTYRDDFSVHSLIIGLSDHDAQIITLPNIFISVPRHVFSFTRKINNNSISTFTFLLSYEYRKEVFLEKKKSI
jgi:exonuclease III